MCWNRCNEKIFVFIILWISYGSNYFLRKPFGVIKKSLSADLALSESNLGWLDAAFLLPYAAVQMCAGNIGDKYDPGRTVGLALIIASTAMIFFSQVTFLPVLAALLFINGAAQSLCWPSVSKILSYMFEGPIRNTIFGVMSTSCFAGALISTFLAVYIQNSFGYKSVFPICSVFVAIVGITVLIIVSDYTKSKNNTDAEVPTTDKPEKTSVNSEVKGGLFSFLNLFKIKLVPELCFVMACIKLVRYSMYMWLPMYLTVQEGYTVSSAGMISTVFDVGGLIGSVTIGPFINRVYSGKVYHGVTLYVSMSAVAFVGFMQTRQYHYISITFLLIAGAFNSGPDGMISGALSTDIGDKDGRNLGSAVTGLINGVGGLGAVLEGPFIGWLSQIYGWSAVFPCMILVSALAGLVCVKVSYNMNKQQQTEVV